MVLLNIINMSITKKLTNVFAGVVVALVAFSMMASTASAAFTAAQVAALQAAGLTSAQITAMEAIFGGSSAPEASSCATYGLPGVAGVQQAVNALGYMPALVVDGVAGPATKAGVMWAQAKVGASVDGAWGPMTQAAYVAYVAANCSTTTTTTTETTTTTTGSLNGGAGALEDVDFVSSINNEEVGEGQSDVVVLAVDLEADHGSDLMVSTVRVSFEEQGAGGSDDFDDYADEVTVWFEGEQVGSVDVEDMNESSGVWSSSINLDSGAVIEAGEEAELSIAVSALNNIDSSDLGSANNDWEATLVNVRVMDAQGVTMTETDGVGGVNDLGDPRAFYFDSFLSANDVELTVSESNDNPAAQTVFVDEDGGDEVVLLIGELEAEGDDIEITEMPVTIVPAGTGDIEDQAVRFILVIDGDEVASVDSDDCFDGTCTATEIYVFDDFEFMLNEGDTVDFEILVELQELDGTIFAEADSLTASLTTVNVDAIEAEGADDLTANELSGSVAGEPQSFISTGVWAQATSESAPVTVVDGATNDYATFTLKFDVTANEQAAYIAQAAATSIVYTIEDSAGVAYAGTADVETATLTSTASTSGAYFRVNDGQTKSFTLKVTFSPDDLDVGQDYRLQLATINFAATQAAPNQTWNAAPVQDFETGFATIVD